MRPLTIERFAGIFGRTTAAFYLQLDRMFRQLEDRRELLDNYATGTWTPVIGGTATYTEQIGTYTRIGRLVVVNCRLQVNVIGTGSTTTISGLPFTAPGVADQVFAGSVAYWNALAANYVFISCYIPIGTSTIQFTGTTVAASGLSVPVALFKNASDVMLTVSYYVNT